MKQKSSRNAIVVAAVSALLCGCSGNLLKNNQLINSLAEHLPVDVGADTVVSFPKADPAVVTTKYAEPKLDAVAAVKNLAFYEPVTNKKQFPERFDDLAKYAQENWNGRSVRLVYDVFVRNNLSNRENINLEPDSRGRVFVDPEVTRNPEGGCPVFVTVKDGVITGIGHGEFNSNCYSTFNRFDYFVNSGDTDAKRLSVVSSVRKVLSGEVNPGKIKGAKKNWDLYLEKYLNGHLKEHDGQGFDPEIVIWLAKRGSESARKILVTHPFAVLDPVASYRYENGKDAENIKVGRRYSAFPRDAERHITDFGRYGATYSMQFVSDDLKYAGIKEAWLYSRGSRLVGFSFKYLNKRDAEQVLQSFLNSNKFVKKERNKAYGTVTYYDKNDELKMQVGLNGIDGYGDPYITLTGMKFKKAMQGKSGESFFENNIVLGQTRLEDVRGFLESLGFQRSGRKEYIAAQGMTITTTGGSANLYDFKVEGVHQGVIGRVGFKVRRSDLPVIERYLSDRNYVYVGNTENTLLDFGNGRSFEVGVKVFERRDSLGNDESYGFAVANIEDLTDSFKVEFENNAYNFD